MDGDDQANWDPTTNYNNAGLMVYGDDANFIKAGMVWSGGRKFEAFKELNNTATALGSATANCRRRSRPPGTCD